MRFARVRNNEKLSERVCDQLENAILTGKLQVRERLPAESELGRMFGVSRTVVREALQRLEAQGLIASHVGSGSYVAPFDPAQLGSVVLRFAAMNPVRQTQQQILDFLSVVENEAIGRLAESRCPKVIAKLEAILDRVGNAIDEGDFLSEYLSFHIALVESAGNPLFSMVLAPLKEGVGEFANRWSWPADKCRRIHADLREVLDAVRAGDSAPARSAGNHLINISWIESDESCALQPQVEAV